MRLQPLTSIEYATLSLALPNLADGHARLKLGPTCLSGAVLEEALKFPLAELEHRFLVAFYNVAGVAAPTQYLLCESASLAIDAVFKLLRQRRRLSIDMLTPTFDNLQLLGRRAGMTLRPLNEGELPREDAAGIFLVTPNNPTGWVSPRSYIESIIDFCQVHDTVLIIDRAFRFLVSDTECLDEMLDSSDIDWITIDDSGKTWSTLENKVAPVQCGRSATLNELTSIAGEISLSVSPLALTLIRAAIADDNGARRAREAASTNRDYLANLLHVQPRIASLVGNRTSVALLRLDSPALPDSTELCAKLLHDHEVGILPGAQFFWDDPERGARLLRLALLREPEAFAPAAESLVQSLIAIAHSNGET